MFYAGLAAVAALWVVAGAGANLWFLARGDDFSGFADQAPTSVVQDTWESLVVPHHAVFIGLLIAFEASAGAAVLVAEGEAKAIETVFAAIHEGNPDNLLLAYQYLQTLPKIAEGASNKLWFIPSELSEALRGIGEGFASMGKKPSGSPGAKKSYPDLDRIASETADLPAETPVDQLIDTPVEKLIDTPPAEPATPAAEPTTPPDAPAPGDA